jgi:dihydroorotate dehydrogenase (fumarate)
MDLSTTYLGLPLKNPLIASSSPLMRNLDNYKRFEDAGIAAIVKESLFEEQINHEIYEIDHYTNQGTESFAESLTYYPEALDLQIGAEAYLKHIGQAKTAVDIPIIASLNGFSLGGWTSYAKKIEEAGADALELNIYSIPTDPRMTSIEVEQEYIDIVREVKSTVRIPVAVKMSPYFSSLANMAKRLDDVGADGLVLFNRFYQPDIDLDELEVKTNILLSSPQDLRLPLRWIAILYGQLNASLAATSGVHTAEDALKILMVGADAVMVCSTILKNGISEVTKILNGLEAWMEEREYRSVEQMKGCISQKSCPDPKAFERAYYIRSLKSYSV